MGKKIKYILGLYKKYGYRPILFLFRSKLKRDKLSNIRVHNAKSPITLSNFNTDVTTLFQIFFAGEYDVVTNNKISFIIDCGANIGLSAVYFASKYPGARIIAVEPDKTNFHYLQLNTKQYKNVTCLNNAIWPRHARMNIVETGTGNWGLQTKETNEQNDNIIESITIEEILHNFQANEIDLLKIDIEGAEKDLFSFNYSEWLKKTKIVAIELHDHLSPGASENFFKAIEPMPCKKYYIGENLVCDFS
jgi:FkbM family methyltransferase